MYFRVGYAGSEGLFNNNAELNLAIEIVLMSYHLQH